MKYRFSLEYFLHLTLRFEMLKKVILNDDQSEALNSMKPWSLEEHTKIIETEQVAVLRDLDINSNIDKKIISRIAGEVV